MERSEQFWWQQIQPLVKHLGITILISCGSDASSAPSRNIYLYSLLTSLYILLLWIIRQMLCGKFGLINLYFKLLGFNVITRHQNFTYNFAHLRKTPFPCVKMAALQVILTLLNPNSLFEIRLCSGLKHSIFQFRACF